MIHEEHEKNIDDWLPVTVHTETRAITALPVSHSPLPWQLIGDMVNTSTGTMCISCDQSGDSDEQDYANAAFIIRACNNHDTLTTLLKEWLSSYDEGTRKLCGPSILDRVARTEAAIRKAEGN